jgi:branched-chain amino acid transport system permease protein
VPLLLVAALVAPLPLLLGGYALSLLIVIGLHALAALGLGVLMGQAGQVSLAQGAFYGLGAYGSTVLALHAGVPPWLSIPAATLAAAAVALLLGLPAVRLGGHHLALATLGFGIIVFLVFNNETDWTGGPSGTIGIPPLVLFGRTVATDGAYAYVVWSVVIAAHLAVRRLLRSPTGRAFRAIAASEAAAAATGIDVARQKLLAFVLSGALGAVAGGLYAHWLTFVSPTAFGLETSIEFLVMAVLGGLGSLYGPLLGAATVTLLVEALRTAVRAVAPGATGWVEVTAFGAILIGVLLLAPEGIAGGLARAAARAPKRRRRG